MSQVNGVEIKSHTVDNLFWNEHEIIFVTLSLVKCMRRLGYMHGETLSEIAA